VRLADLHGRSIAVWGSGPEGRAAVTAIAGAGPSRLLAVDDTAHYLAVPWEGEPARAAPLVGGDHAQAALFTADVVVRSPEVASTHPWLVELRTRGIAVTGGSALWLAEHAARTVAVTGGTGRSSTAELISHLLAAVGRPNVLGGRTGVPLLQTPTADRYVVELSSQQCRELTDSPAVAAVTASVPEHLDAPDGAREHYRDTVNLLTHDPGLIVVDGTDESLAAELGAMSAGGTPVRDTAGRSPVGAGADGTPFRTAPDAAGVPFVWHHDLPLFPRSVPAVGDRHDGPDLCVALAVLDGMGIDVDAGRDVLAGAVAAFARLPHRLARIS
jgi:UDP-N-acetylmuramoylalanine-D-glutamate ligase